MMNLWASRLSEEQWDSLLKPDYIGLPACCPIVEDFREVIAYIKKNGLNYTVASSFLKLANTVMNMHYFEYSTVLVNLVDYIRAWKESFDLEIEEFEYKDYRYEDYVGL